RPLPRLLLRRLGGGRGGGCSDEAEAGGGPGDEARQEPGGSVGSHGVGSSEIRSTARCSSLTWWTIGASCQYVSFWTSRLAAAPTGRALTGWGRARRGSRTARRAAPAAAGAADHGATAARSPERRRSSACTVSRSGTSPGATIGSQA